MYDKETKLLVWCMGNRGKYFAQVINSYPATYYKIIGYTDSEIKDIRKFYGYPTYRLDEISKLEFDYIVIACDSCNALKEIKLWINNELEGNIKVIHYKELLDQIRTQRVIHKYEGTSDSEIRETVKWLKNHPISVRNQRENTKRVMYEVFTDSQKGDFPYVNFKGKRMYYPKDYSFGVENGRRYLSNIVECDQYEGSPHLYVYGKHKVNLGDIIVDAGVAEGNFALTYIDIVSKAYLIESDKRWLEALKLTFEPYKNKIVLVPKMLSDMDTEQSITLDTLLEGNRVDFVKMDIEGAETDALLGGINVLRKNNVKLSVCAYHRKRDEDYIQFILKALGYRTSHSEGYMFFIYDSYIDETLDFRRGVIYGSKIVSEN